MRAAVRSGARMRKPQLNQKNKVLRIYPPGVKRMDDEEVESPGRNSDSDRARVLGKKHKESLQAFWTGVQGKIALKKNTQAPVRIKRAASDLNNCQKQLEHHRLIHPSSPRKIKWDVFLGLLIMYSVMVIPYRIGFLIEVSGPQLYMDICIDIMFFLDICVNMNTAYVDPYTEAVVMDRKKIVKRYFKGWFWIDLLSTIPFDHLARIFLTSLNSSSFRSFKLIRVLRLARLLKLARVMKLSRFAKRLQDRISVNPGFIGLLKLLFQIVFLAHLLACFWHFMGTREVASKHEDTWLAVDELEDKSTNLEYLESFYWTIATMLAIGYGDVHAVNTKERVYSIAAQVVGAIMFGAVIAKVSMLIAVRSPASRKYKEAMDELKAYLQEKPLPRHIVTNAKMAYSYYLTHRSAFPEYNIFNELPSAMLTKLVTDIYSSTIAGINLLKVEEKNFVSYIVVHLKPFVSQPGEVIFERGDIAEEVVFLGHGLVNFVSTDLTHLKETVVGYCTPGHFFGDFGYYKRCPRQVTYTAVQLCNMHAITKDSLDAARKYYPISGERLTGQMHDRYANLLESLKSPSVRHGMRLLKSLMCVDNDLRSHADVAHSSSRRSFNTHTVRVVRYNKVSAREEVVDEDVRLMASRWVVSPSDPRKIRWDVYVGALIVYSVVVIPYRVGYSVEAAGGWLALDILIDISFGCDIILNFRTAYMDKVREVLVTVPSQIARNYFRFWFWIDFISTVPLDHVATVLISSASSSALRTVRLLKVARLFRLLKLMRLLKLGKFMMVLEDRIGVSPAVFDLCKLLAQVTFIAHLISCVWFYAADAAHTNDKDETWFGTIGLKDGPPSAQYVAALYWTFTTMTTVGYGDIVPVNKGEKILAIIFMIIGATVFGWILAHVANLVGNFSATEAKISERMSTVVEYVRDRRAGRVLQAAVTKHFRYLYTQTSAFEENQILGRLPLAISREILFHGHREIIKRIPIFSSIESRGVTLYLFRVMTPAMFDTQQYLIREGEHATDIFFLLGGEACVIRHRSTPMPARSVRNITSPGSGRSLSKRMFKVGSTKRGALEHESSRRRSSTSDMKANEHRQRRATEAVLRIREDRELVHVSGGHGKKKKKKTKKKKKKGKNKRTKRRTRVGSFDEHQSRDTGPGSEHSNEDHGDNSDDSDDDSGLDDSESDVATSDDDMYGRSSHKRTKGNGKGSSVASLVRGLGALRRLHRHTSKQLQERRKKEEEAEKERQQASEHRLAPPAGGIELEKIEQHTAGSQFRGRPHDVAPTSISTSSPDDGDESPRLSTEDSKASLTPRAGPRGGTTGRNDGAALISGGREPEHGAAGGDEDVAEDGDSQQSSRTDGHKSSSNHSPESSNAPVDEGGSGELTDATCATDVTGTAVTNLSEQRRESHQSQATDSNYHPGLAHTSSTGMTFSTDGPHRGFSLEAQDVLLGHDVEEKDAGGSGAARKTTTAALGVLEREHSLHNAEENGEPPSRRGTDTAVAAPGGLGAGFSAAAARAALRDSPSMGQTPNRKQLSKGNWLVSGGNASVTPARGTFNAGTLPRPLMRADSEPSASMIHVEESVMRYRQGDFVGHVGLLTQSRHSVSIRATTPCSVYVLSKLDIAQVLVAHPWVAVQLQNALATAIYEQNIRMRFKHEQVKNIDLLRSAEARNRTRAVSHTFGASLRAAASQWRLSHRSPSRSESNPKVLPLSRSTSENDALESPRAADRPDVPKNVPLHTHRDEAEFHDVSSTRRALRHGSTRSSASSPGNDSGGDGAKESGSRGSEPVRDFGAFATPRLRRLSDSLRRKSKESRSVAAAAATATAASTGSMTQRDSSGGFAGAAASRLSAISVATNSSRVAADHAVGGKLEPEEVLVVPSGDQLLSTTNVAHLGGGRRDKRDEDTRTEPDTHDVPDELREDNPFAPFLAHEGKAQSCPNMNAPEVTQVQERLNRSNSIAMRPEDGAALARALSTQIPASGKSKRFASMTLPFTAKKSNRRNDRPAGGVRPSDSANTSDKINDTDASTGRNMGSHNNSENGGDGSPNTDDTEV